jgi:hypothetical protein
MKEAEIYGFIGWIGAAVVMIIYLLWGFLPE